MARGGAERTYSIWGLVALFTVLTAYGVLVFIGGSPTSPTEQVAGPQTPNTVLEGAGSHESAAAGEDAAPGLGAGADDATGAPASTSTAPSSDPSAPVTVPGGAPAPEGVREVLNAGGATSFTFDVPSGFSTAGATTAVAPTRVTASPDGMSLVASIGCAASSQEVLAQLSANESDAAVTVVAVVLVPAAGAPCDPGAASREVSIPLSGPLGTRTVVVVPAGTPIPQLPPS